MIIGAISDWCESAWGSGLFNLFERRVAYQSGIISRFAVKDSDSDSDSAGLKFERSTVQKCLKKTLWAQFLLRFVFSLGT
jgi:hypothetical protein